MSESARFGEPPRQAGQINPLPFVSPGLREHVWPNPWRVTPQTLSNNPVNVSGQGPDLPQPAEQRRLVE